MTRTEQVENFLISKRMFRDQNQVGLTCNAGPKSEMTRVSPHYFDNLYPTVRSRRRTRTFDYFRNISKRGIEAELVVSACQILVECLRHADNRNASLREKRANPQRVFSAANDESIEF